MLYMTFSWRESVGFIGRSELKFCCYTEKCVINTVKGGGMDGMMYNIFAKCAPKDLGHCRWDLAECRWDLADCGWDLSKYEQDLPEWLESVSLPNAKAATGLGSIPASSDTVESEGWQTNQSWMYIKIHAKNRCKKERCDVRTSSSGMWPFHIF
jgi:hypothetical protein